MVGSIRTPPRFVPTLTTVVDPPSAAQSAQTDAADMQWPRSPDPAPALESAHNPRLTHISEADSVRLEEQLLHRVLQRVDLSLERRLSDAVSTAVRQQLDAMVPRLREEIEDVLRSLVIEALAQELSENTGSVPSQMHRSLG